jgi:hypothetical protein
MWCRKSRLNTKCQVLVASIILGGVIGFALFASEARGRGRVIEFGWYTDPSEFHLNHFTRNI